MTSVESKAPGGTSTEALAYRFTDEALPFEAQAQTGRQEVTLAARNLASGVYFVQMTAGNFTDTRRVVLVK